MRHFQRIPHFLLLTCHKANPPEARVQRHLDLSGLVLLQDNAFLHQQPVVCGHSNANQQQSTGPENGREQRQGPRTEWTHLWGDEKQWQESVIINADVGLKHGVFVGFLECGKVRDKYFVCLKIKGVEKNKNLSWCWKEEERQGLICSLIFFFLNC